MPSTRGRLFLLIALCLAPHPARGQSAPSGQEAAWQEPYRRGVAALEGHYWGRAIEELTRAVESRPASGPDYYPYLKLGIAYFNLEQFDAAVQAFDQESRAGAIAQSEVERQNLTTFRALAADGLATAVSDLLEEGRRRESRGQLERALESFERGLAISPGDESMRGSVARLRERLAAQVRERDLEQQVNDLMARAKEHRSQGRLREGSALLRQAVMLKPTDEANALLADTMAALRSDLLSRTPLEERPAAIAGYLSEAETLETQGRPGEALERLQAILALQPSHPGALVTQHRLARAIGEAAARAMAAAREQQLVKEGQELLERGQTQQAADRLHRVLSLDPGNESARSLLWKAYAARAGGGAPAAAGRRDATIPPIIVLANRPNGAGPDGQLEDQVPAADYVLSGVILTNQGTVDAEVRWTSRYEAPGGPSVVVEKIPLKAEPGRARGASDLAELRFGRRLTLEPGVSSIEVSAKDPRGLTASTTLRVRYAPSIVPPAEVVIPTAPVSADAPVPPIIILANREKGVDAGGQLEDQVERPEYVLSGVVLTNQPSVEVELRYTHRDSDSRAESTGLERMTLKEDPLRVRGASNLAELQFGRRHTLAAGLTALEVIATDPRGMSARSALRVRYTPPPAAFPWLYASLGGAGLLAGATALGVRAGRRRRLRRRRFNPFMAGAPVLHDDLFLGRERLLSRILETVHNNSILLYGERRIGKTSLQHHLRKRLLALEDPVYQFFPVYIDLEGTPEDRFFERVAIDLFEEFSGPLMGRRPTIPGTYESLVKDVQKLLRALRTITPKKVKLVLLMDEVDVLNSYDPRVNQRLRSLFMKSFAEELVAVVSGVAISHHWASEGSPWYNFFEEIEVRPFSPADARELIESPIRGVLRLEPGVPERIVAMTGCKPYLIQKMGIALVNRAHDSGRRSISLSDVEAVGLPDAGGG